MRSLVYRRTCRWESRISLRPYGLRRSSRDSSVLSLSVASCASRKPPLAPSDGLEPSRKAVSYCVTGCRRNGLWNPGGSGNTFPNNLKYTTYYISSKQSSYPFYADNCHKSSRCPDVSQSIYNRIHHDLFYFESLSVSATETICDFACL